MRPIESTLARWLDLSADPGQRWQSVCDLNELVQRHNDFGAHPPYSFHDPTLPKAPLRLAARQLVGIADGAIRVLLDPTEAEPMRISAVFLLGKTHQRVGLHALATLLRDQPDLPSDLVRQCAFTFDTLGSTGPGAGLEIDLAQVGDHFERYGIPWDHATGRALLEQL